jgi:lipid II:glycine glycyltransferase (peptidoglycan interpeptide bridge formation enzyme)
LVKGGHVFNWLTVSKAEFLDHRPVELIDASVIEWAVKNGNSVYNFGASPPDAVGLIKFKEKWGAKKHSYKTYTISYPSRIRRVVELMNASPKKMMRRLSIEKFAVLLSGSSRIP